MINHVQVIIYQFFLPRYRLQYFVVVLLFNAHGRSEIDNINLVHRDLISSGLLMYLSNLYLLQYAGDTRYARLHLDRIKADCLASVTRNTSLWVPAATEHAAPRLPPPDLVDFLCVNDCGGHGQCSRGEEVATTATTQGRIFSWSRHRHKQGRGYILTYLIHSDLQSKPFKP